MKNSDSISYILNTRTPLRNLQVFIFGMISVLFFAACDSPLRNEVSPQNIQSGSGLDSLIFEDLQLDAKHLWSEGPHSTITKNSKLIVLIYNNEGVLTDLPEEFFLEFYSTMPDMRDHEPSDIGEFEHVSIGVYENTGIVFQMGGRWKMELSVFDLSGIEKGRVEWQEFL